MAAVITAYREERKVNVVRMILRRYGEKWGTGTGTETETEIDRTAKLQNERTSD